ncbi:glycosyltransferase [Mycolicibacterium gilvum]|uniref:glycosyltransferase n=1 Tax=Mycolicibacterium gilvum TaxID=1804 RepID=UPI0040461A35
MEVISALAFSGDLLLILPSNAEEPPWAANFPSVRSRFRGVIFEQLALPWLARGMHLYSMAGPAPVLKWNQTVVMHDATPFRYPKTFRRAFVLWYWLMYGVLSRTAERVLTVSSFSRRELAQTLKVSQERFDLAPCGSDHIEDENGEETGSPLPFSAHSFALIVGNLAPHKNVDAASSALAAAGLPVVVVGARQQVFRPSATSSSQTIRFVGRVDDAGLRQLYRAAAVLVAPSLYEGFGIPIVEAGRLGCPSVFALGSAMTEVAGEGGLGFQSKDMAECVTLVKKVVDDPSYRQRLSVKAQANAQRFSWDRTAQVIFRDLMKVDSVRGRMTRQGPLRVLHVTETFTAGTGAAIIEYSRAARTHGVDTFLLAQDRGVGLLEQVRENSPFNEAKVADPGLMNLARTLRSTVDEVRPDIVHLHSSLAGVVGRLQPYLPGRPLIAYSPHCFAFERRDISRKRQWAYRFVESVMARRTDAFICVSPHEAALAKAFGSAATVHDVLNAFGDAVKIRHATPDISATIGIVTVGRIVPQKDPSMFLEILAMLRSDGPVAATWVGDGDPGVRDDLVGEGVSVTGWLPMEAVPNAVAGHTAYLHTARWEAGPIAVLDAMIAGLPVVVRRIPSYEGLLPQSWQFDDVASAAEMIRELADPDTRRSRIRDQLELVSELRKRSPDVVMANIYRRILGL